MHCAVAMRFIQPIVLRLKVDAQFIRTIKNNARVTGPLVLTRRVQAEDRFDRSFVDGKTRMNVYCQKCGLEVGSQYRMCPTCGSNRLAATPLLQSPMSANQASVATTSGKSYGGFWRRLAAYLIDSIILFVGTFVIGFIYGALIASNGQSIDAAGEIFLQCVGIVAGWIYFASQESSEDQATVGKRVMGLQVCDLQGSRLSFGRASGRFFAKILSGLILLIGFLMIAFTQRRQGLHDKIASTVVLHGA